MRLALVLTTLSQISPWRWAELGALLVGVGWVLHRLARRGEHGPLALLLRLGVHMVPVVLLSAVFLDVGGRLRSAAVGGTDLSTLVLAAAVTTPWLSQAFTSPFYLEHDAYDRSSPVSVVQHFLARWPQVALRVVPVTVVVAAAMTLLLGWSWTAGAGLAALLVLNVWYAQSLTPAYMLRSGRRLLLAWLGYALALLVLPTAWWLPPVVGLVGQTLLSLRVAGWRVPAPRRVPRLGVGTLQGALTAAALWSLPWALYLRAPGAFPAALVFLSLVPATLVYQTFFAQVSGNLDDELERFRHELEHGSAPQARRSGGELYGYVRASAATLLVGGVLVTLVSVAVVDVVAPGSAQLFALLCGVGLAAGFTTLQAYQLALLQQRRLSLVVGAVVLVTTLVGAGTDLGATAFVALVLVTSLLAAGAVGLAARAGWRSGAYTLFWSRALGA